MALKTVVTDSFLNKLLPVLNDMDRDEKIGPLTLAMLVPSSVHENYRSLVISSPNLDSMGLLQATSVVLERLWDELGPEANKIDSVSVLRTHDSAVRILGEAYDIPKLGTTYQAKGLPSLRLDDPILFIAKQVDAVAA
jgi:hypothetical protein